MSFQPLILTLDTVNIYSLLLTRAHLGGMFDHVAHMVGAFWILGGVQKLWPERVVHWMLTMCVQLVSPELTTISARVTCTLLAHLDELELLIPHGAEGIVLDQRLLALLAQLEDSIRVGQSIAVSSRKILGLLQVYQHRSLQSQSRVCHQQAAPLLANLDRLEGWPGQVMNLSLSSKEVRHTFMS